MSFLAPLWLSLVAVAAVPLLLHLLRRRIGTRVEFPAARYLARAEREHSRSLRLRNLLLMVLRVAIVLLLALAAAEPFGRWLAGSDHAPTALALVVDNSLSASAVAGDRPLLERFREAARLATAKARSGDRLWLVTADGRTRGGSAATIREAIDGIEPLAGAGDPRLAVARASAAVRASGFAARQIGLLTDGQRSAWAEPVDLGDVSVVAYAPRDTAPENRAVVAARASPVRWTPRGAITGRVSAVDSASYRITIANRPLLRGSVAPGSEIRVSASPPERGWVSGTIEIEPDELPADNVRHYAVWIGPAPGVRVSPAAGEFVGSAVDVLKRSGRLVDGGAVVITPADEVTTAPSLILAPASPVRLGAANRALERAGIPWRFGAPRRDAGVVRGTDVAGATTALRYQLVPQASVVADTLATVGADPWIVAGPRYVIVGSPMLPEATTLPVRAAFVPWLADVIGTRLVGEPGEVVDATPGAVVRRPFWADALESPTGGREPLADATFQAPDRVGTYFLNLGARRVGALTVNPDPAESDLARLSARDLERRLRARRIEVSRSVNAWVGEIFRSAGERPLTTPLLLLALIALLAEGFVAGAGGTKKAA